MNKKSFLLSDTSLFTFSLAAVILVVFLAPLEKTLGQGMRIVYFHGAWVWVGIGSFVLTGIVGLAAIFIKKPFLHTWSAAGGRTALGFWIASLPMSLLVMQLNWNGFYFDEPRWRIPFTFAVIGILLQFGLYLINKPILTSVGNFLYAGALIIGLNSVESILHPDSPILNSNSTTIKVYFLVIIVLLSVSAYTIFHFWLDWDHHRTKGA